MALIDQFTSFTGIRAVETFCQLLQLNLKLAVAIRLLRSSTDETAQPPWPRSLLHVDQKTRLFGNSADTTVQSGIGLR